MFKTILSNTVSKLKDPSFWVAGLILFVLAPLVVKQLRKVPVVGDKLP